MFYNTSYESCVTIPKIYHYNYWEKTDKWWGILKHKSTKKGESTIPLFLRTNPIELGPSKQNVSQLVTVNVTDHVTLKVA